MGGSIIRLQDDHIVESQISSKTAVSLAKGESFCHQALPKSPNILAAHLLQFLTFQHLPCQLAQILIL